MTPPDQPEEAPSALSRLERALAGFGQPNASEAPEPEAETEPDVIEDEDEDAAYEDEVSEADVDPEPDEVVAPTPSTAVLDIAAAVAAVEQLSPPTAAAWPPPPPPPPLPTADEHDAYEDEREPEGAAEDEDNDAQADADARVLATTAAGVWRDLGDDETPDFEPPDLRSRFDEFAADDDAPAPDQDAVFDEPEPEPERNIGDTALPYFLVEDNLPVAQDPVAVATVEDLRERIVRPVADPVVAKPKEPASIARTLAEIPVLLIVAALIAFLVKTFLAQAYYIPSGSMIPQLQIDDRVVVSKLAYKFHDPRRGDIVVFDNPSATAAQKKDDAGLLRKVGEGIGIVQPSTDEFIKRVIGLPGETVEGKNGHVFVNGHQLVEPYLKGTVVTSDFDKQRVRPGRLWVMGDNRTESADSRFFGQVKERTIVGRALVKVWPFSHISFL